MNSAMLSTLSDLFAGGWARLPDHSMYWDRAIAGDPALVVSPCKIPLIKSDLKVGVEVEFENYHAVIPPDQYAPYIWAGKKEGSLRNKGWEFVSYPMHGKYIVSTLNYLKKYLATQDNSADGPVLFTDLAGLHTHLNVRDMDVEEFASLMFLYTIFEETMFRVSGNRAGSIFCVPLHIAGDAIRNLFCAFWKKNKEEALREATLEMCHNSDANVFKYMALNYRPVVHYGTVEFRHHVATGDPSTILNWVNLILCLGEYSKVMDFIPTTEEVFALNTNSEYDKFAKEVFGDRLPLIQHPNLSQEMAAGVSKVKNWCIPVKDIYVDDGQKSRKAAPKEVEEEIPFLKVPKAVPPGAIERVGLRFVNAPRAHAEELNFVVQAGGPQPEPPPPNQDVVDAVRIALRQQEEAREQQRRLERAQRDAEIFAQAFPRV